MWWGAGVCGRGRGHAWQGDMHTMHAPPADTMRYGHMRAVRILLECMLATS